MYSVEVRISLINYVSVMFRIRCFARMHGTSFLVLGVESLSYSNIIPRIYRTAEGARWIFCRISDSISPYRDLLIVVLRCSPHGVWEAEPFCGMNSFGLFMPSARLMYLILANCATDNW